MNEMNTSRSLEGCMGDSPTKSIKIISNSPRKSFPYVPPYFNDGVIDSLVVADGCEIPVYYDRKNGTLKSYITEGMLEGKLNSLVKESTKKAEANGKGEVYNWTKVDSLDVASYMLTLKPYRSKEDEKSNIIGEEIAEKAVLTIKLNKKESKKGDSGSIYYRSIVQCSGNSIEVRYNLLDFFMDFLTYFCSKPTSR